MLDVEEHLVEETADRDHDCISKNKYDEGELLSLSITQLLRRPQHVPSLIPSYLTVYKPIDDL